MTEGHQMEATFLSPLTHGAALVADIEAALPTQTAPYMILLHLDLLRGPDGEAILAMLATGGRRYFLGDQALHFTHADGSSDTCVGCCVTSDPSAQMGFFFLDDMAQTPVLHVWTHDRPLPSEGTTARWIGLGDEDET